MYLCISRNVQNFGYACHTKATYPTRGYVTQAGAQNTREPLLWVLAKSVLLDVTCTRKTSSPLPSIGGARTLSVYLIFN